ncbi:MAG TPA: hypothetical protein VK540_15930 [Polyangiaceae bacterium]|nr:hypothetical protein [Polyangiaceae bacterium]
MSAPIMVPDLATAALASLSAARSASDVELKTFYCAAARSAVDQLDEHVRKLRLNLTTVEKELVRLGAPKALENKESKQ